MTVTREELARAAGKDFSKLSNYEKLQFTNKANYANLEAKLNPPTSSTPMPPNGDPLRQTVPNRTPARSQTPAAVQTTAPVAASPTANASGFLQKVASIPKVTPVTPDSVQTVSPGSISPSADPNGVLQTIASMPKPTVVKPTETGMTPSPSAYISGDTGEELPLTSGARVTKAEVIRTPITAQVPTPVTKIDENLVLRGTPGYAYAPGTDPARMANTVLTKTPIIDAGLKDAKNAQVQKYSETKNGFNLVGGNQKYVYKTYSQNSRDRGVFVDYPGSSRRYDSTPQRNSTMARLAIPIAGSVSKFITDAGLTGDAAKLAQTLVVQGNSGLGYIDFLLQSVNEGFSEKVQISETVGDNYAAFFFGMSPPTFQFSGQLLNTFQDEWRTSMHILYQNLLRGTRLARTNSLVSIYYDRNIVNGYIVSHNQNFTAEMQMASAFNFTMLVKSITFFRLPETVPTTPQKIPGDIAFNTIAGIKRGAVQKTTRTVGNAQYQESDPKAKTAEQQATVATTVDLVKTAVTNIPIISTAVGPNGGLLNTTQLAAVAKDVYNGIKALKYPKIPAGSGQF